MARLTDFVPRGRIHDSDFKCSSPGDDEEDLLGELARLARIPLTSEGFSQSDGRTVELRARIDGRTAVISLPHRKYQFPPRELIDALNAVLAARADAYELVAVLEPAGRGEAVARVRPDEKAALRAAGLLV